MSKIMNIAYLDVSEIQEDLAKDITEIMNIGVLVESDNSQVILKDCKKTNIGASIKLPKNLNVKMVTHNGELNIDREYLEGLIHPIILMVNGKMTFQSDINKELLDEKIYLMMINGELVAPKNLSGVIHSKSQVNGNTLVYNTEYIYINNMVDLTNRFLKSLKPKSQFAVNNLVIIEDIDLDLLKDKVLNIQVLGKLVSLEKYDEVLSNFIDEYYNVEISLVPEGKGEVKYIKEDIKIDNSSIQRYNQNRLYVEGNVEIYLKEELVFNDYIEYLVCDKLICDIITYNRIKNSLDDKIEVEIIKGKLLNNSSKLILNDDFLEETTIKNMGKLIISERVSIDNFKEKVASIINYGVIVAPEYMLSIVRDKTSENFGKIKSTEDNNKNLVEETENIIYSNVAELKL